MSRRHGWKLPSNSWTLSSFVVVIYTLRHSFNSIQFCTAAENISGPVMLEQYVAIADYKKQNRNEVSMVAGDIVEVIDKNENGKFCILYFLPCPVFDICYISGGFSLDLVNQRNPVVWLFKWNLFSSCHPFSSFVFHYRIEVDIFFLNCWIFSNRPIWFHVRCDHSIQSQAFELEEIFQVTSG